MSDDIDFLKNLDNICVGIVNRSRQEMKQGKPWQDLYEAAESDDIEVLISAARNQIDKIVLSLAQVIEEKYQIKMSNKLFSLLQALPYAMNDVQDTIQEEQGLGGCADKMRRVYAEEVMAEIKRLQHVT